MLLPIEKIKELYKEYKNNKKSISVLSKENNINKETLRKYFIKYCGYKSKRIKHDKIVDNDIVDQYYKEYLETGISQSKFAKKNNICRQCLSEKFKIKYPNVETLKLKTNKLSVNSNAFSTITNNSAYWLGIMLTDGYVNKDYKSFELTLKDKEHIEKFKNFLQSEHTISKKSIKINNKICESWRLTIRDDQICNDLKRLNCINNKSYNIKLPKIDNSYHSDLIRGIFDGDGCISHNKNIDVTFCSACEDFLYDIIEILNNNDIKTGRIYKSRNLYSFRISSKKTNLNNFFNFIYNNSNETNRLNRKYKKFLNAIAVIGQSRKKTYDD